MNTNKIDQSTLLINELSASHEMHQTEKAKAALQSEKAVLQSEKVKVAGQSAFDINIGLHKILENSKVDILERQEKIAAVKAKLADPAYYVNNNSLSNLPMYEKLAEAMLQFEENF